MNCGLLRSIKSLLFFFVYSVEYADVKKNINRIYFLMIINLTTLLMEENINTDNLR